MNPNTIGGLYTGSACLTTILAVSFGQWLKKGVQTNVNGHEIVSGSRHVASQAFEGLAVLGKAGLIVGLLILALENGNVSYVKDHPKEFMQDALATGGTGALAAVFLTMTRGRTDLALNHFVFALMLFFMYHVCRELAGYFAFLGSEKLTNKEKSEQKKFTRPILIAGGIATGIALLLALFSRISPDFSSGIFSFINPHVALGIEALIFAAIVSVGEAFVSKNHGEPVFPAFGQSMVMFTVAHLVLQGGGMYHHLYGK